MIRHLYTPSPGSLHRTACGTWTSKDLGTTVAADCTCKSCLKTNAMRLRNLGRKVKHRPAAEPGRVSAEVLARKLKVAGL